MVLVAITQTHCQCFCIGPVGSLGYRFGHLPRFASVRADPCVDSSMQPTICDCHKTCWQDIHFVHFTYSISHPFLVFLFLLRSRCIHCFYFFGTFSCYSAEHSQHSSSSCCQKFGIMFSTASAYVCIPQITEDIDAHASPCASPQLSASILVYDQGLSFEMCVCLFRGLKWSWA